MQLSKRGEYALRTLIRLGVAHELGREVVRTEELAKAERLPLKFVEQILHKLRAAGYVDRRRGEDGGHLIARPAKEIRFADVIRLMDGRIAPVACASETSYERCTCPDEDHCGLRMLMIDVRNSMASLLERYSLHDVVSVTLRKMRRDGLEALGMPEAAGAGGVAERAGRHADPRDGFLAQYEQPQDSPHDANH